jgi:hypothetical protein
MRLPGLRETSPQKLSPLPEMAGPRSKLSMQTRCAREESLHVARHGESAASSRANAENIDFIAGFLSLAAEPD